ncbi:MAG: DNA replication/repair protein RecF [Lachnospiraceae bacterium]|nr:DNA replication/repair protein RecF [Lachnospiraceae bacterium]
MYIESLALSSFRNYDQIEVSFSPGINILYGDNAQGKTNILEAIYLCATTKSHRGSRDREMIMFGREEAHIKALYSDGDSGHRIDIHLRRGKTKGAALDLIPVKRSGELIGNIHAVCFSPEDLDIIKAGPSARRRFIDLEMCQLDKVYLHDISAYNRVINQRNELLKQIYRDPALDATLDVWDAQLVTYGKSVIKARKKFVRELSEKLAPVHEWLSGGRETLELKYAPDTPAEELEERLFSRRDTDKKLKMSTAGPHRDDLIFNINGSDVRVFGSQGQQRTAALSLKLSELELVREHTGSMPVLLLDDVLSELDRNRQKYLMELIRQTQTIVTCTGMEEFITNSVAADKIYKVAAGQLTETGGN